MNTNSSLYKELTDDEIKTIVSVNFNTDVLQEARLLEGGRFNTTYRICYGDDRRRAVLRCGPVNRHLLMEFEKHLMQAEKYVYDLCEINNVPCSNVLVCDSSKKIIDRDYMIVEYIESIPLSDAGIDEKQKANLHSQIGRYMKNFHSITNNKFGRVSYLVSGKTFFSWYDYLFAEIDDITEKSRKYNAFTNDEIDLIISAFRKHKQLLDDITIGHLVHTDLWDGNVLITHKNGRYDVAAIIDADRAVFGDVDFEFASPWMIDKDFLNGYDMNFDFADFNSESRQTRRKIYLILYDLIEAYVGIAEYNDAKQFKDYKKSALDLALELG